MKVEKSEYDEPVVLDLYNSDLNLVIDASQFSAHPLTNEGFAFMWAGARATHGVHSGKICYEIKVLEHLDVSHLPADEPNPHVVRLGFSVESSSLQLGEEPLSYGYGGTGKISTDCKFKDYGRTFQQGDVVLALLNMDSDLVDISFAVNGEYLGSAYKIRRNELKGKALYPHVLTKNCAFEVNFGQKDSPMCNIPNDFQDFRFIGNIPPDTRERGTLSPERREDCEMIMMCGLPGAGKTVWAAEYAAKNPDKKYNVLGTNNIIDKMRVMGLPRKRNYHGRWDVLIKMATKCLNKMFEIGSKLRRNYILDQTNVYPTAQRRKMRNFEGFKRKAVVVVPTEEEYKRRCDKRDREEGKEIPDSAVLEMKANFKLPEVSDIFDEVIFTELQRDKAEELVKMYNEEGRAAVGPPTKRFHPNDQPAGGGGNRGGRNSGFDRDRDRDRGGSRDRGGDRGWGGRGGYNSPGPRNSWGEGSPQSGFDRRSPPRGGPGFGGPGGPRGFGGPGGFDGPPGGFGPGGRSPGGFGDYGGGYGGGSPGYGDRSPGGFGRGGPGSRGGFSGRGGRGAGGYGGSRDPPFNDSGYGGPEPYGGGYGREPGYGGGYEPRGYGDELRGGYGGGYGEPGPRGGGYGDGPRGGGYGDAGRGGGYFDRSRGPGYGDNGPRGGPPGGYGDRPGYGGPNDYESSGYGKRNYDGSFKQESGGYGGRDSDRGGYGGRGGGRGGYADRAGAAGQGSDRGGGSYNRGGAPGGNSGSGYGASPGYGDTGPGGGYGSGSAGRGGSRGGASNRGYAGGGGGGRGGASGAGRGGPAAGPAASRWQSDNSQRPGQTDSATSQNQGGYGAYGAVKSEPASGGSVTSSYPSYDQSYGGYSSSAPTSGYQSYGYQSQTQTSQPAAPAAAPASQQWDSTASSVTAPTAATAPMGAAQSAQTSAVQATPDQYQQQWAQYYQQPQQQYYNPYYGQQAGGAATTSTPVYGTSAYGAK